MGEVSSIVVVGAGVTGLSIALHLAEAGSPPLVLDRDGVGAGASGVQPGGVRQQWSTGATCVLARESLGVYRDLRGRLGTRAGSGFDACGYVFLAHSRERLAELREHVAVQRAAGVRSRVLTPEEAAELVPGLVSDGLTGAATCDDDGYLDRPQAAVEAFAEAAQARGVRIERGFVASIGASGGGFRLDLGDRTLDAELVVLAAGCESAALAAGLGVSLPIRREARHLFYSRPISASLLRPLVVSAERRFAAKQLADGRLLASDLGASGDPEQGRDRWRSRIARVIEELLPALSHADLPLLVSGDYDVTPDHQPIVGPLPGAQGALVAAGFSGHGFMLAPAIGRRVADAVLGRPLDPLLDAFAPDRFASGRLEAELQTV